MEPSKIHFFGPIFVFVSRTPIIGISSPMAKVLACETKTQSAYVIDGSLLRIYEITYVLRLAEMIGIVNKKFCSSTEILIEKANGLTRYSVADHFRPN